jgi:RimJ/RimL family protein N-acetyltransferase
MVEHAFEQQLTRVAAEVRASNVRSIRLLERVGFEREGMHRRSVHRNGGRPVSQLGHGWPQSSIASRGDTFRQRRTHPTDTRAGVR